MFKQLFPVLLVPMILVGAGCTQAEKVSEQPPTSNDVASEVRFEDGFYLLDVTTGLINWEAEKVVAKHNGTVQAQQGNVTIENNQVVSGDLIVDMNSLSDLDLTDEKMNSTLIGHLKSEDFFSVTKYPSAIFTVLETVPVEGLPGATHRVTGIMNIKGIENKVSFPARIQTTDEGIRLVGTMELDRTLWDIKYGSEKFFDNLGDNLINDIFTLQFDLLFKLDTTSPEQLATISETVCYYQDKMLYAGESYNDGCNTHTCYSDGTVLSTEKAC